jgi:hypothetical protein
LASDTHILDLAHVIPFVFYHFFFQFAFVGLAIQPCKCSTWAFFGLPFEFNLQVDLCCCIDNIKILDVLFGFESFFSFFCKRIWMKMFVMLMHLWG